MGGLVHSALDSLGSLDRSSLAGSAGAPRYQAAPWWPVSLFALVALATVVLAHFVSRDVARMGEIALLLVTLAVLARVRRIDPGWWLFGVILVYGLWMALVDHTWSIAPERVNPEQYPRRYLKQYGFLLAGWWVGMRPRLGAALLSGGLVGCLIGLAVLSDSQQWVQAWNGGREDFGFHNAQHTAVYAVSCLMAIAYLTIRGLSVPSVSLRVGLTALGLFGMGGALFVIAATQTRQSWVALTAAAIGVGIVLWRFYGPREVLRRALAHRWKVGAVTAAIVIAAFLINPFAGAWQRTQNELGNVATLLEGEELSRYRSITIRLTTWRVALGAIAERPLQGWGGGANGIVLNRSTLPESLTERFGHYHNSYLGSAVHYGLPGLVLWLLGPLYLLNRTWRSYASGDISTAAMSLAFGWLFYWLAVNAFETYINYDSGYYVVLIMGGAIYGWTLRPRSEAGGS